MKSRATKGPYLKPYLKFFGRDDYFELRFYSFTAGAPAVISYDNLEKARLALRSMTGGKKKDIVIA